MVKDFPFLHVIMQEGGCIVIRFQNKEKVTREMADIKRKTTVCSWVRLLLAVLVVFFAICFLSLELSLLYLILSVFFLALFIAFTVLSNPFYHRLKILKNLENVYLKHENRRNGHYQNFGDDGRDFILYDDYKILDLDLLGPRSLYQYLCSAKTKKGREQLAKQLTSPIEKEEEFRSCVSHMATDENLFRLESTLLAMSKELSTSDVDECLGQLDRRFSFGKKILIGVAICYLLILAAAVFLWQMKWPFYYLILFFFLNFFLCRLLTKHPLFSINATKYADLLAAYEQFANDILATSFHHPYFEAKKAKIKRELPALIRIKKMMDMLSYRKNFILNFLGNGLFFMDVLIGMRYDREALKITSVEESIQAMAEIEVMLSFANIGFDNETYCSGKKSDRILIDEGYHPLIKKCVPNSFSFSGGVVLTGSNMSGKTTFQRMLGINQILWNAGCLVCAAHFEAPFLEVKTSLRANDLLQEGISTFYAEIKRMKAIMDTAKKKIPSLVLVDEIFKGTNAKDRIASSFEIMKTLQKYPVFFIITTHDFELCSFPLITNYHFDEKYENDQIFFDYKIKKGKSTTTNARYLLKMAGVLENLE